MTRSDFSCEDTTGQINLRGQPTGTEENTATGHQKPDGEGQMDVTQNLEDVCEEKPD